MKLKIEVPIDEVKRIVAEVLGQRGYKNLDSGNLTYDGDYDNATVDAIVFIQEIPF